MKWHILCHFMSEWNKSIKIRISEYQVTPFWKQVRYLKLKWLEEDLNPKPPSLETKTDPFSQNDQIIELCCDYTITVYGGIDCEILSCHIRG